MMQYVKIESKDNSLVKKVVKLSTLSSYRKDTSCAIVYGEHLVLEALKYGLLESVFFDEYKLDKYKKVINCINVYFEQGQEQSRLETWQKTSGLNMGKYNKNLFQPKIYITNKTILDKMNVLDGAVDLIGIIKFQQQEISYLADVDIIALENIRDPGNLGAIFRVAQASGIMNVCLSKSCVDIYNPKVLRGSQGIQFGLNVYPSVDLIQLVAKYSGQVIATSPVSEHNIYDMDLNSSVMFLFGNEGEGISPDLLKLVGNKIKIPMMNDVESLNITTAVTVCSFEMLRQRFYSQNKTCI